MDSTNDDVFLSNAKDYVSRTSKKFPWDANGFLCQIHELPETSIVTKEFLQYSADDVGLTSLAAREVLWQRRMTFVKAATAEKLRECVEIEKEFRVSARVVREAEFTKLDLCRIEGSCVCEADGTDKLLERWGKLKKAQNILKISCHAACRPLLSVRSEAGLVQEISRIEGILIQPNHLHDVRLRAKLACPPGTVPAQLDLVLHFDERLKQPP